VWREGFLLGCTSQIGSFLFRVLLSTRTPAGSTLFPYTTLFRSGRAGRHPARSLRDQRRILRQWAARVEPVSAARDGVERDQHQTDRKSTRLNSSHVKISYAVFCLKKKKETNQRLKELKQRTVDA